MKPVETVVDPVEVIAELVEVVARQAAAVEAVVVAFGVAVGRLVLAVELVADLESELAEAVKLVAEEQLEDFEQRFALLAQRSAVQLG